VTRTGPRAAAPAPADDPADLTVEWMQAALVSAGFDVVLTGVEVEPVGTGQMSVSLRVRCQAAAPTVDAPESVIVKIPSPDRAVRQLVCAGYRAEIAFYEELAPTVAVQVPACYLAVANADASSFTLLLEDLAPAAQGDQVAGASLEAVTAAARNLAGLHGPRWCDPALRRAAWPQPGGSGAHRFTAELVSGALPQLAERLGPALSAEDLTTLERSAAVLAGFLGARAERFAPIHGDYRLDNLLFGPGAAVSAVDWQTLDLGLPARDLAYLAGTSLSIGDRRAGETDLVGAYWRQLVRHGVDAYTRDECFDDYRLGMLHCPLIIVLGAAYGTRTERGDTMFATMVERSCAAMRDLGTLALAEALP